MFLAMLLVRIGGQGYDCSKYVARLDELAAGNVNGVKIVHLADFLLSSGY